MTPERYQRLKAVYQDALERDPAERLTWLEQACAGDVEMRDEIISLLAESAETKPLGDLPTLLDAAPTLITAAGTDLPVGPRVGPYRILSELGHGGMGAVYLAERIGEFKKRVAIKVVKRGMDSAEILARFLHERQILASLDHPNIARLLDGGTTDDGLPYFVMEHIEGVPIDEYCRTRRLTTAERLPLFRTVCAAVHYAHQNLVVHRDLKPSNILVTTDGTVKLLDFGIAKILNPELFPETVLPTRTWERPMTPAYASPEQVRGQAITTASDVYSLGVVLYELLTGQPPYRFKSVAPHEIAQVVCETEPERPSTAVIRRPTVRKEAPLTVLESAAQDQAGRLSKQLKGDLDNIVLMALRKEPQRRYASAEQFSEDIRRHLEGLPVIAREDTFTYRAGKFVARNRLAVAAAAIIVVLLIGFLITTLIQSRRVARERDRARLERDKAEQVANFLVELFKVNDPGESKGNQVTARELLDRGAARITSELKGQPEVQANLMDTIGKVYVRLGLYDHAEELLNQALQTRRALLGPDHADTAQTLLNLTDIYYERGDHERAEQALREVLTIRRQVYGVEHKEVADVLHDLAVVMKERGKLADTEQAWNESLAINRKLFGAESLEVSEDLVSYASFQAAQGDIDGAERSLRASVNILRRHRPPEDTDLMTALNNLAIVLGRKKDYAGAVPIHRELLATKRRIYASEHPDVALSLNNLGNTLRLDGKLDEAEPSLREAVALRRKLLGTEHQHTALSTLNLGRLLAARGRLPEAESLARAALAIIHRVQHTAEHLAYYQDGLAECLLAQRKFAEAEQLWLASYQTHKARQGAQGKTAVEVANKLVGLYEQWGKPDRAAHYRALSAAK